MEERRTEANDYGYSKGPGPGHNPWDAGYDLFKSWADPVRKPFQTWRKYFSEDLGSRVDGYLASRARHPSP